MLALAGCPARDPNLRREQLLFSASIHTITTAVTITCTITIRDPSQDMERELEYGIPRLKNPLSCKIPIMGNHCKRSVSRKLPEVFGDVRRFL